MTNSELSSNSKPSRIIAFDLDGTLASGNIWETINSFVGISVEQDQRWLQEYETGKLTYETWMTLLSVKYKQSKKKQHQFERVIQNQAKNNISPDVRQLIGYLQKQNEELCIVSGGIDLYVSSVASALSIPRWFANNRFIFAEDGTFDRIVFDNDEGLAKVHYLRRLSEELSLAPTDFVFIGDSPNDLDAFEYTQHGIYLQRGKYKPELAAASWRQVSSISEVLQYL